MLDGASLDLRSAFKPLCFQVCIALRTPAAQNPESMNATSGGGVLELGSGVGVAGIAAALLVTPPLHL